MTEQPFTLARTAVWDMPAGPDPSGLHRIFLAWPEAPPPPAGYPVLFVLDANAGFATAVEAYRALVWRSSTASPQPALIVGLGHPGGASYDTAGRRQDYTPSPPATPPQPRCAEAFLRFIEQDVLAALERRHAVDRSQLSLFGHSLGGLFALHTLFTRPGLFRAIIAASPSLWWGEGLIVQQARRFATAPPPEAAGLRLLVTVGGLEESDAGPRGAIRVARRMIGHAREVAALLRQAGLMVEFTEFAGEDHGSARPPALARAPRFALPKVAQ